MNREDFLMRLSSLLQDVSEAEREEALQYYEDYFDDAGKDKEEEIIDALGSPAEVAKNIKKELFGIETEEEISREDRKLTKYGSQAKREEEQKKEQKKATLPTWVWVLIVISLILLSPGIIGSVGTVIAVICALAVAWFSLIFGFGMAAVVLLVVMVGLFIVGFAGVTVSPMGTVGLIGGGLLCGGIGILFLMLTVAMAGAATPAIWRGLVKLCKWIGSLFTRKKA